MAESSVIDRAYRAVILVGLVVAAVAIGWPYLKTWRQEQQLEQHAEQLEQAGARLDQQEAQLTDHGARLDAHDAALAKHGSQLAAHDAALTAQSERAAEFEKRLGQARADATLANVRIDALQEDVTKLQDEVEALRRAQQAGDKRQQAALEELLKRLKVLEDNAGRLPAD